MKEQKVVDTPDPNHPVEAEASASGVSEGCPRPAPEQCFYCGEFHLPNDGSCNPNETVYFEDEEKRTR